MFFQPEKGGAFLWHQDYGYWYQNQCLTPDMGSVFMPVDRCTKENSCLQVNHQSVICDIIKICLNSSYLRVFLTYFSSHSHFFQTYFLRKTMNLAQSGIFLQLGYILLIFNTRYTLSGQARYSAHPYFQVLAGSHKMGRIEHYLMGDQSGADPDRVQLAKQR